MLLLCTLRSTVAFFFLFFTLDMAFLFLGIGYADRVDGAPREGCIKAGGVFGILAAFLAWYNALAGIADTSNRYVGYHHDAHFQPRKWSILTFWQFLLDPRRPFPVVREGPREACKGQQHRSTRCRRSITSFIISIVVISITSFATLTERDEQSWISMSRSVIANQSACKIYLSHGNLVEKPPASVKYLLDPSIPSSICSIQYSYPFIAEINL